MNNFTIMTHKIITHKLKGIRGWGDFISDIEICRINSITYGKRLFCLTDVDYKYKIEIKYYNPRKKIAYSPSQIIPYYYISEYDYICARYKTHNLALDEIN